MDRRMFKKEGEELQQYLHFRKRGSIVENKKKNKKISERTIKICAARQIIKEVKL